MLHHACTSQLVVVLANTAFVILEITSQSPHQQAAELPTPARVEARAVKGKDTNNNTIARTHLSAERDPHSRRLRAVRGEPPSPLAEVGGMATTKRVFHWKAPQAVMATVNRYGVLSLSFLSARQSTCVFQVVRPQLVPMRPALANVAPSETQGNFTQSAGVRQAGSTPARTCSNDHDHTASVCLSADVCLNF